MSQVANWKDSSQATPLGDLFRAGSFGTGTVPRITIHRGLEGLIQTQADFEQFASENGLRKGATKEDVEQAIAMIETGGNHSVAKDVLINLVKENAAVNGIRV